jgi:beta-glucanase (GH16 family)
MPLKSGLIAATLGGALAMGTIASPLSAQDEAAGAAQSQRTLLMSDEFNGEALDRTIWNVVGPDIWFNNEQQVYVDDPAVLSVVDGIAGADGGALMLRPLYKPGIDPNPDRAADFVSARIHTQDKFDFTHGRAEARIKLPDAEGVWPAWWLLGNSQWPGTGEIDIMEYVGEKDWIGVALHGPGYSGETPIVNKFFFPQGEDVTDWHVYAVEWTSEQITFEVDGHVLYRVTRPMVEHYGDWRFDTPKHLILNFAVGGAYPIKTNGIQEPYVGVPQYTVEKIKTGEIAMLVDWVRVYAPEGTAEAEK